MCSICGGTVFDKTALKIFNLSQDRGRDYSNMFYRKGSWICNHRAVPTTEIETSEYNQPFGTDYKIVHNGTIANDKELGNSDGLIDSSVLATALDFSSAKNLAISLEKIKGSYAIGIMKPNGRFMLACNYKPIFYAELSNGFFFSSYKEHFSGIDSVKRLQPYSVYDEETGETAEIKRNVHNKALVICSGGLDSTAVAAYASKNHDECRLLHFQYGCIAETKETECIKRIANKLNCDYDILPLNYNFAKDSSRLFGDEKDISKGIEGAEYANEWVPARNLVMLSIAVAYAESKGYSYIYLGTNLEEGGAYPDNEQQFIKDFNSCLYGAVQNGNYVEIRTPVGNLMKHEIVKFGNEWDAPFEDTWSCYRAGEKPCRNCGPCFMRETAFKRNGLIDPLLK